MKKKAVAKAEIAIERTIISVRNVIKQDWSDLTDAADKRGIALWAVLSEMIDDWLKKKGER